MRVWWHLGYLSKWDQGCICWKKEAAIVVPWWCRSQENCWCLSLQRIMTAAVTLSLRDHNQAYLRYTWHADAKGYKMWWMHTLTAYQIWSFYHDSCPSHTLHVDIIYHDIESWQKKKNKKKFPREDSFGRVGILLGHPIFLVCCTFSFNLVNF